MAYQADDDDIEGGRTPTGDGAESGTLKTASSYLQWWLGSKAEALELSLHNRYLISNVVYVVYVLLILYIDYTAQPAANDAYSDDDYYLDPSLDNEYRRDVRRINELYIVAGVIHLINAFMYIWSWFPAGYGLTSVVMIPEYLNVIGASLYLYTASIYGNEKISGEGAYLDDVTIKVHRVETAAASIEVIAAFGWAVAWWMTYPRDGKARGFTLDDPDLMANVFIVVPSILYAAYNAQIMADYTQYGANTLYVQGDVLYAIGAGFYVLAALRDDGWFESFYLFQWLWSVTRLEWLWQRVGGEAALMPLRRALRLLPKEENEAAGAGERTALL